MNEKELREEIESYFNANPRDKMPKILSDFLKYAKKFYKDRDNVNWTYFDNEEEQMELIEDYIGNSSEALLLMELFLMERGI